MTPEEQFDRLVEQWKCGATLRPVESSEMEGRLAAAETFIRQLQALVVPPAFAARLETRLRTHARNLAAPQGKGKVIRFPRAQTQSWRHQRTEHKRQRRHGYRSENP